MCDRLFSWDGGRYVRGVWTGVKCGISHIVKLVRTSRPAAGFFKDEIVGSLFTARLWKSKQETTHLVVWQRRRKLCFLFVYCSQKQKEFNS